LSTKKEAFRGVVKVDCLKECSVIFELRIFFKRPVSTPSGLVMFSKAHVEAPTLADAKQLLIATWEARRAAVDYIEGDAAEVQDRSHYTRLLTNAA
jgi:hypothetical protein